MTHKQHASVGAAAAASLAGRVSGRLVHFGGQILAARVLGPAGFGVYSVVWAAIRILSVPAVLGLDVGVLHHAAKHARGSIESRDIQSASLFAGLVWSSLLGIGVFLCAPLIGAFLFDDQSLIVGLQVASITIPGVATLRIVCASMRSDGFAGASVIAEDFMRPLAFVLMLSVLLGIGTVTPGAVFSLVAISYWAVTAFASLWFAKPASWRAVWPRPLPSRDRLLTLILWAVPVSATSLTAIVALQVDQFLIATVLPSAQVGMYAGAVQLVAAIPVVLSALDLALGPRVSRLTVTGDWAAVEFTYSTLARWGIMLLTPIFCILLIVPSELAVFAFGEEFVDSGPILSILGAGFAINAACGGVALVLFLTGNQSAWLRVSVLGAALNIAGTLAMAATLGTVGAASAAAAAMAIQNVLGVRELRRRTGVSLVSSAYIRVLATVFSVGLLVSLPLPLFRLTGIWAITYVGLATTALLLAASTIPALGLLTSAERASITSRLRRIIS